MSDQIVLDERGNPVLLADVPNAGVSRQDPNAKSGNPRHDVRSGKFGAGGGGGKNQPQRPDNIASVDWFRMLDAVREVARQADNLTEADLRDFISARAQNPKAVNLQNFQQLIDQQRIADLVDILDGQMRKDGLRVSGRRNVRLVAPKGHVKKMISNLSEQDLAEVAHRLEARGHDAKHVDEWLVQKRIHPDKQQAVRTAKTAIAASDDWFAEETVEFADNGYAEDHHPPPPTPGQELIGMPVQLAKAIAENIKPPTIYVQPQITVEAPKPMKRVPVRDENGVITEIREVEDAED
jgi:hypothetical protein